MSNTMTKRMFGAGLSVFAASFLALVGVPTVAHADSDVHFTNNQPTLNHDITTTTTTAMLSFRDRTFRNETVNVIVSVKERSSDMLVEKSLTAMIDNDGNGTVTVRGLQPNTDYAFKVRIMRMGEMKSTQNSSERSASTI